MALYLTSWTTRNGKRRCIRLYKAYRNMLQRVRGQTLDGNGHPRWAGLQVDFKDWPDFRAWALANGYCKKGLSLDRKDEMQGYLKSNCQWLTKRENAMKANGVHKAECDCWNCRRTRNGQEPPESV